MTCARRCWVWLLVTALAGRGIGSAQEPVFVTPPVTMFQQGGLAGVEVEQERGRVAAATEAAWGVVPSWTIAVRAVGAASQGASLELARVLLGTRVRLFKVDRANQWILLSAYGAGAAPAGEEAAQVARTHALPDAVLGLSFARMARRGDVFADLSVARAPTAGATVTSVAGGVAVGWRPSPAGYGDAEAQVFVEAVGRYADSGARTLGLAPGILLHTRRALGKVGVVFPVESRRSSDDPVVRAAMKLLF